ncbi:uncharacterized protein BDR25DRAFT_303259 [Lindgomyces ingoldianus]|uniref:Uncharacterized protein n=1 Tax=Lindgomyces ingoldianus TaxID=673940 RepID=A0ACB6QXX4_9PLEO|nr:uncharacterized protein BDR25DRAFT_303259 [Lindgomyces ingoldianus]KAF2471894.1 hypothetical protein BDR25DRAFT_303259 [Lindgomyces ingoldianus]
MAASRAPTPPPPCGSIRNGPCPAHQVHAFLPVDYFNLPCDHGATSAFCNSLEARNTNFRIADSPTPPNSVNNGRRHSLDSPATPPPSYQASSRVHHVRTRSQAHQLSSEHTAWDLEIARRYHTWPSVRRFTPLGLQQASKRRKSMPSRGWAVWLLILVFLCGLGGFFVWISKLPESHSHT